MPTTAPTIWRACARPAAATCPLPSQKMSSSRCGSVRAASNTSLTPEPQHDSSCGGFVSSATEIPYVSPCRRLVTHASYLLPTKAMLRVLDIPTARYLSRHARDRHDVHLHLLCSACPCHRVRGDGVRLFATVGAVHAALADAGDGAVLCCLVLRAVGRDPGDPFERRLCDLGRGRHHPDRHSLLRAVPPDAGRRSLCRHRPDRLRCRGHQPVLADDGALMPASAYTRAKQPEQVRRALLDCAATIAMDHGVSGITVQAVAAAAGVTKGGLFHHFG